MALSSRRKFLSSTALIAPLTLLVGKEAFAELEGGIDELAREVGYKFEIPLNKSVGITGALFHIAREQLLKLEFVEIARFLPGLERFIFQSATVLSSALPKTMAGMPDVLQKLSLPPEATVSVRDFILGYLRDKGGKKIAGVLQRAWKTN